MKANISIFNDSAAYIMVAKDFSLETLNYSSELTNNQNFIIPQGFTAFISVIAGAEPVDFTLSYEIIDSPISNDNNTDPNNNTTDPDNSTFT